MFEINIFSDYLYAKEVFMFAVPNGTAGPLMGGAANNINRGAGLNIQSIWITIRALKHLSLWQIHVIDI